MMILALDLGKFNTMCCFFDPKIRKPEFLLIPSDPDSLTKVMTSKELDLVVMEACGPSGWISDLCGELKLKTLVCSTNEDAWRWANVKRKTDRDDAYKLARMAAVHELKAVHIPTKDQRQFRLLVKYRKTVDQRITRIKNTGGKANSTQPTSTTKPSRTTTKPSTTKPSSTRTKPAKRRSKPATVA